MLKNIAKELEMNGKDVNYNEALLIKMIKYTIRIRIDLYFKEKVFCGNIASKPKKI